MTAPHHRRYPNRRFSPPPGPRPQTLPPQILHSAFCALLTRQPARNPRRHPARMAALHAAADADTRARARIDALFRRCLDRAVSDARRLSASRAVVLFTAGLLSGLLLASSLLFAK